MTSDSYHSLIRLTKLLHYLQRTGLGDIQIVESAQTQLDEQLKVLQPFPLYSPETSDGVDWSTFAAQVEFVTTFLLVRHDYGLFHLTLHPEHYQSERIFLVEIIPTLVHRKAIRLVSDQSVP